jgi:hypothetical protein
MVGLLRHSQRKRGGNGLARPTATALRLDSTWKLLAVAEKRFRRLDAPHQLKDVFEGRKFEDGKPVSDHQRKEAA